MLLAALFGKEETGAVDNDICANFIPFQVCRVALGGEANLFAVDDEIAAVYYDIAAKTAVDRIILQHVGKIVFRV